MSVCLCIDHIFLSHQKSQLHEMLCLVVIWADLKLDKPRLEKKKLDSRGIFFGAYTYLYHYHFCLWFPQSPNAIDLLRILRVVFPFSSLWNYLFVVNFLSHQTSYLPEILDLFSPDIFKEKKRKSQPFQYILGLWLFLTKWIFILCNI